jgi:hypothetical protein
MKMLGSGALIMGAMLNTGARIIVYEYLGKV